MNTADMLATTGDPAAGNPGPWGQLQFVPILIAPPLQFVGDPSLERGTSAWCFPNTDREALEKFFVEAGLLPAQTGSLLSHAQHASAIDGWLVEPGADLLRSLNPKSRGRIYNLLGCYAENAHQHNAFRFCGESLEQWFEGSKLRPETIELVSRYVYRNGNFLFFADVPLVMPELADSAERQRLVKVLSREATMLMKLRVTPDSDIEQLAAYWTHGRRHKDIRPILESLAALPGGDVLDVVHLLPPFARLLLYTYPRPPESAADTLKDCHWTSLNFLCEPPDNRFLDLDFVVNTISTEYHRVDDNIAFGDLAILCSPHGEVFHSAVHIADGIAFTKQGPTMSRPWMFMRIEQLRDFYPRRYPVEVRYYRRNDR